MLQMLNPPTLQPWLLALAPSCGGGVCNNSGRQNCLVPVHDTFSDRGRCWNDSWLSRHSFWDRPGKCCGKKDRWCSHGSVVSPENINLWRDGGWCDAWCRRNIWSRCDVGSRCDIRSYCWHELRRRNCWGGDAILRRWHVHQQSTRSSSLAVVDLIVATRLAEGAIALREPDVFLISGFLGASG